MEQQNQPYYQDDFKYYLTGVLKQNLIDSLISDNPDEEELRNVSSMCEELSVIIYNVLGVYWMGGRPLDNDGKPTGENLLISLDFADVYVRDYL
jgi:hypothetical protein